ncbi:Cyclopropane-fatty-acyl-phospholipid synthase [Thalassoglobus neptunius]|uniref:Cyclopropane-fatty-acyl-phospholipid synthase n=1 Tax=Thalassoglobus neptunius TaxID=1938619 RepID=A0A5C5W9H7_9PLAN|nr:cyclopropane-fatty-acyl-phospholipid synthase family protein [Thalassoglobus neptunius]TWT47147.1 Cyclopropane-fatty-acyl-phospholipid synthase [Thalassoglobus neptunius]
MTDSSNPTATIQQTPPLALSKEKETATRGMLLRFLSQLKHGRIELILPDGSRQSFGESGDSELQVRVELLSEACYRKILLGGSLGAAEAYLQGLWTTDDLTSLLRLMCRNLPRTEVLDNGWARIGRFAAKIGHWLSRNSFRGSQRNVAAHYDLSNDFFQLFLDPTMMYSSGIFPSPEATMEQASVEKMERVCRLLELQPGDHVIEIGSGWGGFSLYAARQYGCRITTTTISQQQYDMAGDRIRSAGLSDRVTLLQDDYRTLVGQYDKLVSIEMIEAVGHQYLPSFFQTCNQLLVPDGKMVVQAITIPDNRYDEYFHSVDFIRNYIFPGGHLPSIGAMQRATERTGLLLQEMQQFPDSYARTLQCWRQEFEEKREQVLSLGFDERFIRMWNYYFCYCEAAFLERAVNVGLFVWDKQCY